MAFNMTPIPGHLKKKKKKTEPVIVIGREILRSLGTLMRGYFRGEGEIFVAFRTEGRS